MQRSFTEDLPKLDHHLKRLMANPQRLEDDRSRFNKTPEAIPPQSGTTTVLTCSPPPETESHYPPLDSWEFWVNWHRVMSQPERMYLMLKEIEVERINALHKIYQGPPESAPLSHVLDVLALASRKVQQRWRDEGVWHGDWIGTENGSDRFGEAYKHEAAFKGDPDDDPKGEKTEEQKRIERDASRPLNQFLSELRREKEWYEECREAGADNVPEEDSEIETQAYESIRQRWKHYHLWDARWGRLPGPTWRHEMPLAELVKQKFEDNPALLPMTIAQRKSIDSRYTNDDLYNDIDLVFMPTRRDPRLPTRPNPKQQPQEPKRQRPFYAKYGHSGYWQKKGTSLRNKARIVDTPKYARSELMIPLWRIRIGNYEICFSRRQGPY